MPGQESEPGVNVAPHSPPDGQQRKGVDEDQPFTFDQLRPGQEGIILGGGQKSQGQVQVAEHAPGTRKNLGPARGLFSTNSLSGLDAGMGADMGQKRDPFPGPSRFQSMAYQDAVAQKIRDDIYHPARGRDRDPGAGGHRTWFLPCFFHHTQIQTLVAAGPFSAGRPPPAVRIKEHAGVKNKGRVLFTVFKVKG